MYDFIKFYIVKGKIKNTKGLPFERGTYIITKHIRETQVRAMKKGIRNNEQLLEINVVVIKSDIDIKVISATKAKKQQKQRRPIQMKNVSVKPEVPCPS